MKDRRVIARRVEDVNVSASTNNTDLQSELIAAVERLASDPTIAGRFFRRDHWALCVRHTDVMALLAAFRISWP
jgi:hypothetical protein